MRNKENTAATAELTIADLLGALEKIKPVFSIAEFCEVHGFTRPLYYELKKQGRGPREMAVGRRRMITQEAAAEWRRRMEAETADAAAGE